MVKYIRYRYILLETSNININELKKEYLKLFGEVNFYKSSFKTVYKHDNYIIIRINSQSIDSWIYALKSLGFKKSIEITPLYIGSTVKSVKSKLKDLFNIED